MATIQELMPFSKGGRVNNKKVTEFIEKSGDDSIDRGGTEK